LVIPLIGSFWSSKYKGQDRRADPNEIEIPVPFHIDVSSLLILFYHETLKIGYFLGSSLAATPAAQLSHLAPKPEGE
jgi:hypothetical protein